MYYVWKQDRKLAEEYAYFSNEPDGYDIDIWISGEKMTQDPPSIVITTDEDGSTKLTDLLLTGFNIQIFSSRLIRIFEDIGIKNIDYYPVKIINHETGDVEENYKAAQIIGKIGCLDVENSKCRYSADGIDLMSIKKFSLHEDKIKPNQKIEVNPLVFRLAEFEFLILVAESVKDRLKKEGIVGVKFIKPSDYVG